MIREQCKLPSLIDDRQTWELRRYEIAKELFAVFTEEYWRDDNTPFSECIGDDLDDGTIECVEQGIAEISIRYSNELIRQLKQSYD